MDLSRYLGLFVSDAREHLAGLEGDALRLERAANDGERRALLDAIFRHLHSLKSSSATMGLDPIAQLSHLSEELVGRLRAATRPPAQAELDLLVECGDELRALVDVAADGGKPLPRPLLADRLARAAEGLAPPKEPGLPAPLPVRPVVAIEGPTTRVVVKVSTKASAPAARAFLALRKLEGVAAVAATEPPIEQVREGKLPGHRLVVTLRGVHALEMLQKALGRLPDLDGLELAPADAVVEQQRAIAAPAEPVPVVADQTVRVRVELLDQLLELAGELVLASSRLREKARALPEPSRPSFEEESDRLRLLVKELNNRVLATRQTPVQLLADRLPRVVRDLSRRLGKPIELVVEGGDVTLDRGLVDALAEPLMHVIRNAADHAIEEPEVREKTGKRRAATLVFAARRERERVIVELRDDGRGFDTARLREKAVRQKLMSAAEAEQLSDEAALRLAFLPGLSTREATDDLSGRGVGMDAVLRSIEQLGGTVQLLSTQGKGSTIRFLLPATVSVVNLLLLSLGQEVFGLPMSRVLLAAEAEIHTTRSLQVNGERVPAYPLGKLLGLPEDLTTGLRPCVVVEAEGQRTAVAVDRLLGQEEVVLRPLGPPLERIRGLAGTAILGSGRPVFVLDVPRLVA